MSARAYEVTLISATERTVRNVIAHRSVQAVLTALRTTPEQDAPLAIICKPLAISARDEPCAA